MNRLPYILAAGLAAIMIVGAGASERSPADLTGTAAPGPQLAQTAPPPAERKPVPVRKGPSAANTFNRLLKKPAAAPHAAPAEDGIHDPANPGTLLLQWPAEAFQGLPPTNDGNRIDWIKVLDEGLIVPWYDFEDPAAKPFIMDLVIVREVKGSMPNVVFPHKQHTEWLDCTNCHDEIFVPAKGENQISMAAILLGQKCGVCHGKVAFPVTDCRRCHAQPKTEQQLRDLANKSSWSKSGAGAAAQ